jgi:cation diffusion facilitator family transporter
LGKAISSGRAVWTSFIVDLGDIVLNVIIMLATGSVVMLAEAFEGFSDLVASTFLLIGLRIAKRRPNKKHPFGYGKSLFFWTLISAIVMLIFGAGLSIYFGVRRFLEPEEIDKIWLAYGALLISIATNGYALILSTKRLLDGEKLGKIVHIFFTTTHVETKNTLILDLTGTASAVFGMIALVLYQVAGVEYFDAAGAVLIGVIIGVGSLMLIFGVKDYLVGKTASVETEKEIREAVLGLEAVAKIRGLDTMYIGSERLMVHLDVDLAGVGEGELGAVVDRIKKHLKKAVPIVYSIQVEVKLVSAS